jgi:hypothetical protein
VAGIAAEITEITEEIMAETKYVVAESVLEIIMKVRDSDWGDDVQDHSGDCDGEYGRYDGYRR